MTKRHFELIAPFTGDSDMNDHWKTLDGAADREAIVVTNGTPTGPTGLGLLAWPAGIRFRIRSINFALGTATCEEIDTGHQHEVALDQLEVEVKRDEGFVPKPGGPRPSATRGL